MIRAYLDKTPALGNEVFVAETAAVIGDVVIGARSSIWFGAVLRGDVFHIRIGEDTSIQDNAVLHVTHDQYATQVGSRVTVGHSVTLHGCTVGDSCIIGAGALVTPGTKIPAGHLAVGSPARPKRPLTEDELSWLDSSAGHYAELVRGYAADPDWND